MCPLALGRHKVAGSLRQVITLNLHKQKDTSTTQEWKTSIQLLRYVKYQFID